jgi:hypothetical protein
MAFKEEHRSLITYNKTINELLLIFHYSPKLSKPITSSTHPVKNVNNTIYSIPRPCKKPYVNKDITAVGPIETSLTVPNTTYK